MNDQRDFDLRDIETPASVQTTDQVAVGTPELPDGVDEAVPTSRKGALIGFGVIVLAVVTLFGFALAPRTSSSPVTVSGEQLAADPRGDVAPDFTGALLDGSGNLSLSSLRGKTVVVNFWASWCSTCKEEAKVVADVARQWSDKGVVFLGIDSHDTDAGGRTYVQTYGLGYASVLDPDSRIGAAYRVTGLPETFFLDTRGRIVEKYVSAIDQTTLDSLIRQTVAAG